MYIYIYITHGIPVPLEVFPLAKEGVQIVGPCVLHIFVAPPWSPPVCLADATAAPDHEEVCSLQTRKDMHPQTFMRRN